MESNVKMFVERIRETAENLGITHIVVILMVVLFQKELDKRQQYIGL